MQQFDVTGMSCAACSTRVEKAVSKVSGVTACSVNLLTNSMQVEGTASAEKIIHAVEKAGYGASCRNGGTVKETSSAPKDASAKPMLIRFIFSAVLLVILMYISMGHVMWHFPLPEVLGSNAVAMGITELLLTGIIMVIHQKFFINGWKGICHFSPNMDTLVGMGSAASFVYSTYVLFRMTDHMMNGNAADAMNELHHNLYYESAAMILVLISVGKLLEAYAKGKTTSALKSLLELAPKTATLLRDGEEVSVPIEQVKRGDIFLVRAGEQIPADGCVISGHCTANESALTGESLPVDKAVGDMVSAGTITVSGFVTCRAEQIGEETLLAQIIRMVNDAAATKAPIAKIADKVSGVFVPIVIGIALLTWAVWMLLGEPLSFALSRSISVLVISCPCALGLATPVAIMVGSGVGARNGLLFKHAAALEQTGKTTIAVLDKTGTITEGMPVVTDIQPAAGYDKEQLLALANALEQKSEHPLAKSICTKAAEMGIQSAAAEEFETLSGSGIRGIYHGKTCYGGNRSKIETILSLPPMIQKQADELSAAGKTPLFFTEGDAFAGIIAVADCVKSDSAEAIEQMKEMGMSVIMLTGDNARTAQAINAQAGADEVISDVLPNQKEAVIRNLKKHGSVVMVGDGINDAPALTRADIGIAIGSGTDIAIEAADVVLMNGHLTDVPAAIRLSRATLRNIRENLFWAFIYNIIGIPLAAGVWIPIFGWELSPMFGAAAMSLSSSCVVLNALRLNFCKPYQKQKHARKRSVRAYSGINSKSGVQGMELAVEGMMCGHCEATVQKILESLPQVQSAKASHETGIVAVQLNADDMPSEKVLKKLLKKEGYELKSAHKTTNVL